MLLRGLLALAFSVYVLIGPEKYLAGFVWILGLYWVADGAFLTALFAAGPLRRAPWSLPRGLLEILGGFPVVTNPALGLLEHDWLFMAAGACILAAAGAEAVCALRSGCAVDGPGAHGVAGALLGATGGGFLTAPYMTALNFSVFLGGATLAGGIALVLYAVRIGVAPVD